MTALKQSLLATAALMLILGRGPALAASSESAGVTATVVFEGLSPAEQKIAHALFLAQQPTAEGPPALNLNQIAAIGGGGHWRAAFERMRRDGLIRARSLAQVVSGHEHRSPHDLTGRHGAGRVILMSGGNGRMIAGASDRRPASGETPAMDRTDAAQAGGTLAVAAAAPRGDSASAHP
jgi:hypothetical protein